MRDQTKTKRQEPSPHQYGLLWPTGQEDARQCERIKLFRMAQRKVSWYCRQATQIVLALVGLGFFLFWSSYCFLTMEL